MAFRVGQKVKLRPYVGEVPPHPKFSATPTDYLVLEPGAIGVITSALVPAYWSDGCAELMAALGYPRGSLVHTVEWEEAGKMVGAVSRSCAPPAWLEPYDDGREAGEWTEELRRLCGIGEKRPEKVA